MATNSILEEYLDITHRIAKKINRLDLYKNWSLILPNKLHIINAEKHFQLCRDPKDDKFIDCAFAGQVRYIISGDNDLLILKKVNKITIIDAKSFLQIKYMA
ncbi:MAG: putative toxin-antitoxin system toxin component, PIN family [Oligoflexia bacterium]|nr:putative toxin-antitoxin system toxin component, PIN family [Oligoflexia bacterium]